MDTITKMVAFWVTRVGEAQVFPHTRKDTGETFSVKKYPLTLIPSIESGFDREIQFTTWVTSQEVANKAKVLAENTSERLALVNSPRDFDCGTVNTSTYKKKVKDENGDEKLIEVSQKQLTVYLRKDAQPMWVRAALPQSADAGNIRSVDVSDIVKVVPKVTIETDKAPF